MYKQCTGSLPRFQLFQSRLTKWLIVDREIKRTQYTPSHFWHTPSHFALRENVFTVVSVQWKNVSLFDWRWACLPENILDQQSTISWVCFGRVGNEGGSRYIVCTLNNCTIFFKPPVGSKTLFFSFFDYDNVQSLSFKFRIDVLRSEHAFLLFPWWYVLTKVHCNWMSASWTNSCV